jgi:NADPH:quinone reductase-like Zn-dependent oxidoreductase
LPLVRAVVITEPGGPDVLQIQDVPAPEPASGEVLVDVAASAVNHADLLQRRGHYPATPGAPPFPGLECSGTVAGLGADVSGWTIGQRVCALLGGGGYAEQVTVPAGQLPASA